MVDILNVFANSPLLALLGFAVLLAMIFAPAALALAGLTGTQIVELLRSTMSFIVEVIREFRSANKEQ